MIKLEASLNMKNMSTTVCVHLRQLRFITPSKAIMILCSLPIFKSHYLYLTHQTLSFVVAPKIIRHRIHGLNTKEGHPTWTHGASSHVLSNSLLALCLQVL